MHRRHHLILAFLALALSRVAVGACPPDGYDVQKLRALKDQHFVIADAAERKAFAKDLLACLASPDAELRDRIAYEAYAAWRHNKALDADTWKHIERALLANLDANQVDPAGVIKPFAALVLVEAVKADRAAPYLDDAERHALLSAAIAYFVGVRDYRGFDTDVGWRHGVAHAADLLAQLALLPSFGKAELDRILAALATQIVASDAHFYTYGESERMAEAVATVAVRGMHTTQEWDAWLSKIADPAPFQHWGEAYWSQAGLAKRHDAMAFLLALYADTVDDKRVSLAQIAPLAAKAMQPLH
jgi:hypothetical protein